MDTIKKAMMICVSCKDWNFPRHILLESENFTGERIDELALRCFEMYKTKAGLPDLELIDYTYYGDVETLKEETSDLYWVSFLIQETCCSNPDDFDEVTDIYHDWISGPTTSTILLP